MSAPVRARVYCVVPRALAGKLHEPLRLHWHDDPMVEVIVEQRVGERRAAPDRRGAEAPRARRPERRRIRGSAGRRAGERRAAALAVDAPGTLPRKARAFASQLVFVERLEPSTEELEDMDTARVVARFQAGEAVFSELYMRYFDRVYTYLKVALRDQHDAEDATQQVFMKVLEALPRYERRRQPFRAWLFVIVRNQVIDDLKKRGRYDVEDPAAVDRRRDDPDPGSDDLPVLNWITDRDLLMFIERLPEPQRQVLALRYMLDMSTTEVAQVMDRSCQDVRRLQHRALSFLRSRLTAVGRCPETGHRPIGWRRVRRRSNVLRARRFALID